MQEYLNHIVGQLPFLCLGIDGKARLNTARIIEAVIIAAIGGLMAGYIAVAKMEVRMDGMEKKVDKIVEDIYKPVFRK